MRALFSLAVVGDHVILCLCVSAKDFVFIELKFDLDGAISLHVNAHAI